MSDSGQARMTFSCYNTFMSQKWMVVVGVLSLVLVAVLAIYLTRPRNNDQQISVDLGTTSKPINVADTPTPTSSLQSSATSSAVITADEKSKIDAWIKTNDLNEYGDPKDTMYTGGTPLFDETTGESTDRYDYVIKKYLQRPWNK
jgi:hypothetical protein